MSQFRGAMAAVLTPAGRGAIATVALRGPEAIACAAKFFQPASQRPLVELPAGGMAFGRWQATADRQGEELVVARVSVDELEIYGHGGSAAVEAIVAALASVGCQIIDWTEWVAPSEPRTIAQEALIALADARTERTAAILLDQYRGALDQALETVAASLRAGQTEEALAKLNELLKRGAVGLHLTTPFRVVLAGAPNVGKSSLINALLGYERSIVFDLPGTTRDVVSAWTAVAGWPVELSDTAGLRSTVDPLEAAGVARAERELRDVDLVVWVRDATAPDEAQPGRLSGLEVLPVWNKCDLAAPPDANLAVSARTGQGLVAMQTAIAARICPAAIAPGEAMPFTRRQVKMIEQSLQCLQEGRVEEVVKRLGRSA